MPRMNTNVEAWRKARPALVAAEEALSELARLEQADRTRFIIHEHRSAFAEAIGELNEGYGLDEADGYEVESAETQLSTLRAAVTEYIDEYDSPAPDYSTRRALRTRLRELAGKS